MSSLRTLRWVALAEATSFLALLVASYLKHSDRGEVGVQVLGPIHGILFLAYVLLALLVREEQRWTPWQTIVVIVASAVPFGAFVVNSRMVRDPAPAPAA